MSINITKKTSTHNTTAKSGRAIEYIAIHYTAGVSSKSGAAANIASYFASTTLEASADFIVDDANIVQYNPDPANRYCWAVGGSRYNNKGGSLYGKATNANTVSIEICSANSTGKVTNANDKYWSLSNAAVANAIELTKYLMATYGIDADHVIRHYDVTGKLCPGVVGWNADSGDEGKWQTFKTKIKEDDDMTATEVKTIAQQVINENAEEVYNTIDDVPTWGKETVEKLITKGALTGTDKGLELGYTLLRQLVINDRMGLYD